MKNLKRIVKETDKVFEQIMGEYFENNSTVEFGYTDAVLLGLLENLNNHCKSMLILLDNNHHSSIDTILRIIFENYVYLKFILERDSAKRAKSYVYSTKIKEIQLSDKLTEESLDGYKIRKFLGVRKEEVLEKFTEAMDKDFKEDKINRYLNEIGMKRIEQKWYNIDGGTKNFKILCDKVGLSVEYNLIYSILSTETHGRDAIQNFWFQEDRVNLLNITKDEKLYLSMGGLYCIEAVRSIYTYYGLKKQLKSFNTLIALNYKV